MFRVANSQSVRTGFGGQAIQGIPGVPVEIIPHPSALLIVRGHSHESLRLVDWPSRTSADYHSAESLLRTKEAVFKPVTFPGRHRLIITCTSPLP